MLVYRVAHSGQMNNGYPGGPYNGNGADWADDLNEAHANAEHPTPWEDRGLSRIYDSEFCCLSSIEGLRSWFDGWLETLQDYGYLIHVYDVPEEFVRIGTRQTLAKLAMGTLVRTEPCI